MVCKKRSFFFFFSDFFSSLLRISSLFVGVFCVIGIYAFFLIFAYFQERIYRIGDKSNNDMFVYGVFLVFLVCLMNTFLSFFLLLNANKYNLRTLFNELNKNVCKDMLIISFTYVFAMLCSNYALTHVTYPTQVLVKSSKMLVVVIGGLFLFGKTYPWYDYFSVLIITCSLILFNFGKIIIKEEINQTSFGLLLLLLSLICDGITGPRQDKILSIYNFSSIKMMFYTNLFSLFWCIIAIISFEQLSPIYFCYRHKHTIYYLIVCAFSASCGQYFIFLSLKSFGSLYTSLITTLRKATSTVLSVYLFNHRLTYIQWMCIFSIFTCLTMQVFSSNSKKYKNKCTHVEDCANNYTVIQKKETNSNKNLQDDCFSSIDSQSTTLTDGGLESGKECEE